MQIKEVVRMAALLKGREDVVKYLDTNTDMVSEETLVATATLVDLVNLVINELATSFVPLVKVEQKTPDYNGRIYYKNLSQTPLKILKVTDLSGKAVECLQSIEYIKVQSTVQIEYEYLPKNATIAEQCPYSEKEISLAVLAFGVAAEFSIVEGSFEEAVMWHKRFEEGVKAIVIPKSCRLKERRWE